MRDEQTDQFMHALSRLLGWIYTLSWSASFYPQPLLNWKRKSTHGLVIDFPLLNVVGFICYTTSTACLLYSPVIRSQYAQRHPASPEPTVRFNDFAFGAHAVILVFITYSMFYPKIWGFQVSPRQRASRPVAGIVWGSFLAITIVFAMVALKPVSQPPSPGDWVWIDVIYTIGYVKLVATFVKYMPQAWLNFQRKSTHGWSIGQILFDVTGGVLSILQLIIDASFQGDWSGITGNPVKLGLGLVSIAFDLIFITQHYVLYGPEPAPGKTDLPAEDSQEPLLGRG